MQPSRHRPAAMADIPTEIIVGGFVTMGAAIGLIWRHFSKLVDNMRSDFKERVAKLEHTVGKQDDEIRDMRRFERDRMSKLTAEAQKLAIDSQELTRRTLEVLRRLDPAVNAATEALERKP